MTATRSNSPLQDAWNAYEQLRFEDALAILKPIPNSADVSHFRGTIYLRLGQFDKAIDCLNQAKRLAPSNARIIATLAATHQAKGELSTAESLFRDVLRAVPNEVSSYQNVASSLIAQQRYAEALSILELAKSRTTFNSGLQIQIAHVLLKTNEINRAIDVLTEVTRIQPNNDRAWNDLGALFSSEQRWTEARHCLVNALRCNDSNPDIHVNLAFCLQQLGEWNSALLYYQSALKLLGVDESKEFNYPGNDQSDSRKFLPIKALYNMSIIYLTTGDYAKGWRYYRARPSLLDEKLPLHRDILPADLSGQSILVLRDQGLGDELFFLRYIPLLQKRGALITYCCHPKNYDLLKKCTNLAVVNETPLTSQFDITLSVGDLPWLLQEFTPPPSMRLTPPQSIVDRAKEWLSTVASPPYFGLTWRAGAPLNQQFNIATRLSKQAPLAEILNKTSFTNGTWIVLQRNPNPEEIRQLQSLTSLPVIDASHFNDDLLSMSALLSLIDQYICVSNTNLHIRVALGKAAKVLVPHPAEWRWGDKAANSPWYPDMHIYRQDADGSWNQAIASIAAQINE